MLILMPIFVQILGVFSGKFFGQFFNAVFRQKLFSIIRIAKRFYEIIIIAEIALKICLILA